MRWFEYLIYLFLFLLPWQTRLILRPGVLNGGNWEYGIVGIYGTEVLLWIIILLLALRAGRSSCKNMLSAIILWLSFVVVSVFLSADRLVAFQQFIHIFDAVVIFLLLTKLSIDHFKAAYAFLVGLAVQAILGIYQFLTQSTFASKWLGLTLHEATVGGASVLENLDGRWLRAYAGLPHPNVFGGYMAAGILLSVVLLSYYSISRKVKFFLLSANCLLLAGLFFSFSRSAWLGLLISLAVYWFFNRRQFLFGKNFQLFFLSSILLVAVLSFIFAPLLESRFLNSGRLEIKSAAERASGYGEAWQLFKKHPFWGVGLGNYTLAMRDEIDSARPAWDYQPAHNIFLLILAELGLVGVLIILFTGLLIGLKISHNLLPIFGLFFILAIFDHYLWTLYSGLALVGAGGGLLYLFFQPQRIENHGN